MGWGLESENFTVQVQREARGRQDSVCPTQQTVKHMIEIVTVGFIIPAGIRITTCTQQTEFMDVSTAPTITAVYHPKTIHSAKFSAAQRHTYVQGYFFLPVGH